MPLQAIHVSLTFHSCMAWTTPSKETKSRSITIHLYHSGIEDEEKKEKKKGQHQIITYCAQNEVL